MRYFLTKELFLILTLRDNKEKVFTTDLSGLYIDGSDVERDPNLELLGDLEKKGLIKFKSIYIYYADGGHSDDYFLNRYSKLLKKGDFNQAKKFAKDSNLEALNKTIDTELSLKQVSLLFSSIFNFSKPRPISRDFIDGLLDMLQFKIVVNRHMLEGLLNEYLDTYRKDELEKPSNDKYYGKDAEYIKQDFFRYKKQRTLFIQATLRKLEIKKPENVEISEDDVSLSDPETYLNKINFIELCLSIEKEEIIKIPNFNSSTKIIANINENLLEEIAKKENILGTPFEPKMAPNGISLPTVDYNQETGNGHIRSKKFKFKSNHPTYEVFKMLYNKINRNLPRNDVLVAGGFYEDYQEPDPSRKSDETSFINEIAKTIREKTGLNTEELVNNAGSLTLIGIKQKPPKSSQINPESL